MKQDRLYEPDYFWLMPKIWFGVLEVTNELNFQFYDALKYAPESGFQDLRWEWMNNGSNKLDTIHNACFHMLYINFVLEYILNGDATN